MTERRPSKVGQIISAVVRIAALPVCFLLPAGTIWWAEAWLLAGLYIAWAGLNAWSMSRNDPGLLRERMKASPIQEGQAGWDKAVMVVMLVAGLGLLIVPGFDAVRFGWSNLPLWVEIVGFALHLPTMAAVSWVTHTNSFAARVVKVDEERGHHVITTGPYAVVRHPMYTAVMVMVWAMPLALGSAWGLVPATVMNLLVVARTALEDRELHENLEGYADYAKQTRYRLLPGVW